MQSKISHLRQIVAAGTKALPDMIKMETLMAGSVTNLHPEDTLPGLLELGPDFAVRSTFNCPVDKVQATADNPPTALSCGHLIGKVRSQINDARNKWQAEYSKPDLFFLPQPGRLGL